MPRLLRRFAIQLALLAMLLPSVAQLLPTSHAPSVALGDICTTSGNHKAAGSSDPSIPGHKHDGHCPLCFTHAIDIGLPPSVHSWGALVAESVDYAHGRTKPHTVLVWLSPNPRGPPPFS